MTHPTDDSGKMKNREIAQTVSHVLALDVEARSVLVDAIERALDAKDLEVTAQKDIANQALITVLDRDKVINDLTHRVAELEAEVKGYREKEITNS